MTWASGVTAETPAQVPRAIKLNSPDQAQGQTRAVNIGLKRTDSTADHPGYGGILWGLGFQWVRPPLDTFKPGTDIAESASV